MLNACGEQFKVNISKGEPIRAKLGLFVSVLSILEGSDEERQVARSRGLAMRGEVKNR